MSLTRKKILESAERLFTEKGYESTSIQDIADDCSIAKGSLYKFFSSKEDLYIEICETRYQSMLGETERIREDCSLSLREQFLREMEQQLSLFFNHSYFVIGSRRESPRQCNDRLDSYIFSLKARTLNYNRQLLIRRYGGGLAGYSWDAALMMVAIAKEYLHMMTAFSKPLQPQDLAVYLTERMDDLVAGLLERGQAPLLSDQMMAEFCPEKPEGARLVAEHCKRLIYEQALTTVRELNAPNARKQELEQALEMIRKEMESDQPKKILIVALVNELGREHELAPYAVSLRHWLEKLSPTITVE